MVTTGACVADPALVKSVIKDDKNSALLWFACLALAALPVTAVHV